MKRKKIDKCGLQWSVKYISRLSNKVNVDILRYFAENSRRALKGMGFYMVPYDEDSIDCMKSAQVWHSLMKELLEVASEEDVAAHTHLAIAQVRAVAAEDGDEMFVMPFEAGIKLLQMHKEFCLSQSEI